MSFAQKNYLQIQGRSGGKLPPKYSIAQIGCFLTSFANLINVNPIELNAGFRDQGIYVDVDDGILDDLGFNSITRLKPEWSVVRTGSGWPQSNDAIVKFHYQSISQPLINGKPNIIDHFCKVADWKNQLILDSWDGVVRKPGAYGQPVAFAEYQYFAPQPVTPIGVVKPYRTEEITPRKLRVTRDATIWPLNYDNWPAIKAHPLETIKAGRVLTMHARYFHNLGGEYYAPEGYSEAGINTADLEEYSEPVEAPPAPVEAVTPTPVIDEPAATPVQQMPTKIKLEQLDYVDDNWKDHINYHKSIVTSEADGQAIDLDGHGEPINFKNGAKLPFYGDVMKDGLQWFLLKRSGGRGDFYGVLPSDIERQSVRELASNLDRRKKFVAFLGTFSGFAVKVFHILTLKNRQG